MIDGIIDDEKIVTIVRCKEMARENQEIRGDIFLEVCEAYEEALRNLSKYAAATMRDIAG